RIMKRAVAGLLLGAVLVLFVVSNLSEAAISQLITVEGKLRNSTTNEPLVGTYNISLGIWTASSGGSNLFSENLYTTTDNFGVFQVMLGSTKTLALPFNQQYYLEVTVNGTTLSPRHTLTSSPTTYRASVSEDLACNGCVGTTDIANRSVNLEKYDCIGPHTGFVNYTLLMNCSVDVSGVCDDENGCMIRVINIPTIMTGNPAPSWGHYFQWSNGAYRYTGFEKGSATAVTHASTNGDDTQTIIVLGPGGCDVWDDGVENNKGNFSVYCKQKADPTLEGCYYYFCD
ncbi:MAG: hypothetical protein QXD77_01015, partial [Candidatus Aenigmatarchaeota archaeon]